MPAGAPRIDAFALGAGAVIAGKYRVVSLLGRGWEGEVYKIVELGTGIERAAKLFFPQRNVRNAAARRYALKLHKLRHCDILIKYHTREVIEFEGARVTALISEFVEGELLEHWLRHQPGHALQPFEALHLLHALARGIAEIHAEHEYHGDLHSANMIVRRQGLGFELKVIDLYHWVAPRSENIQADVLAMIDVFHEVLGGARRYKHHRAEIKAILCGLKNSLILRKFKTAGQLRDYLESMRWE